MRSLASWFLASVALASLALQPALAADSHSPAHSGSTRNLVFLEFVESPPTGMVVSGGLLGVPDTAGHFPPEFRRHDPVSGNVASPGRGAGNHLAFTDLKPGTYRVALVLLEESGLASRLLRDHERSLEDRCLLYGDSTRALTFEVREGAVLYLGKVTRKSRPSLGKAEIWQATLEWSAGDESRALKGMLKRKDLAPWRSLLQHRLAALDTLAIRE